MGEKYTRVRSHIRMNSRKDDCDCDRESKAEKVEKEDKIKIDWF